MKKYSISIVYRGQQIVKMACAKNVKDAAELLGVNAYFINKYGFKNNIDIPFDGVVAYFDSGMLWEKEKNIIRVEMPLEKLKTIIDSHKDKDYQEFKKQIGICKDNQ